MTSLNQKHVYKRSFFLNVHVVVTSFPPLVCLEEIQCGKKQHFMLFSKPLGKKVAKIHYKVLSQKLASTEQTYFHCGYIDISI